LNFLIDIKGKLLIGFSQKNEKDLGEVNFVGAQTSAVGSFVRTQTLAVGNYKNITSPSFLNNSYLGIKDLIFKTQKDIIKYFLKYTYSSLRSMLFFFRRFKKSKNTKNVF
jgi:hypothetical protein